MHSVKTGFTSMVLLAVTAQFSQAAMIIDTYTGWDKSESIQNFGSSNSSFTPMDETYGQTFTVTDGHTILDSFSFWLNDVDSSLTFKAYIMAWTPTNATGPILWSSGNYTTANSAGFEQFTFGTGGLTLTDNSKYVAFLNTSLHFVNGLAARMGMESDITKNYAGGEFVRLDNGAALDVNGDPDSSVLLTQLTTSTWIIPATNYDAAFQANFSAPPPPTTVPEPGSVLAMLSLVSFGAGTVFIRRRRAHKLAA
ncbi:MAG: PEP-CTERM sorting domain-containing protein [Planctomycetaceae bacterium]